MPEQFAGVVVNELRRLAADIDEVGSLVRGKRSLTPAEKKSATEAYSRLKDELRSLNVVGTVGGVRRERTDSEERYFFPAVNSALQALRAPTNTNPVSSNWSGQLSEAATEISYRLYRLEQELKS